MFFIPFPLPVPPVFKKNEAKITDFGATEGADCTEAIKKAINAVHLAGGAVLHFTSDRRAYLPCVPINYEGIRCYNYSPMVYANGETDIALTGEGRLEGGGPDW